MPDLLPALSVRRQPDWLGPSGEVSPRFDYASSPAPRPYW
jgi:hypothetical protein